MSILNLRVSLVRKCFETSRRGGTRPAVRPQRHLQFELLEDRLTPAGILNLFNTGVTGTGTPITSGTDPHYTVVSNGLSNPTNDGPAVFQSAGSSVSANIEPPGTNPGSEITTFDYRTTFTLAPGYDPSSVILDGTTAENAALVNILVNGVSVGGTTGAFNLTSGFQAGTNTLDFIVQSSGGGLTNFDAQFTTATANALAPTLTSISPTSVTTGSGTITLTATGHNFLSNATTIAFNGAPIPTTVASLTSMTATIPASALTTAGTASITAVTTGPGGGTSAAQTFSVDDPLPTLTSITPTTASAGDPDTNITLTGTNFVTDSTVEFNDTPLTTTYISATGLTATIPAADLATGGNDSVTVVNTGLGGGTSAALTFAVSNPVPTLAGVTPATVSAGFPDTIVTLTGTNFVPGSIVDFNGTALATTYVSGTELTATVPAADLTATGTDSITVVNGGPGGGTTAALALTVNNPAPTLAGVTPDAVSVGFPDTIVTLTGTNFVPGSTADFNGTALATTYVSPTQLTATIPAADLITTGTDTIAVVNSGPGGGTSAALAFTVNSAYLHPAPGNQSAAFNGLSAQQAFVQTLYIDALGRAGSVAELNGYLPVLNGPNGQTAVAQAIENSHEGRDNLVKGWYQTYLGRSANGTEEQGFVSALVGGASEATVLSEILGSPEFFAHAQTLVTGGTPQQNFVQALYQVLLDRTPGSGELAAQVGALAGGQTQTTLAYSFLQSPEFRTDLVELYYTTLLDRTASSGEVNYWVNYSGLDSYGIRIAIEGSPEFYNDASSYS